MLRTACSLDPLRAFVVTLQHFGSLLALATSYTAAWSLPWPDSHRQVEHSFQDALPLSTLHRRPHERQRMTRGHRGSLLLRCRAPSSPSPCRFIPAHTTSTGRTARSLRERRSRSRHRGPVNGRRWLNHSDLIAFAVATGLVDCCTNTNLPRSRSHYSRDPGIRGHSTDPWDEADVAVPPTTRAHPSHADGRSRP